MEIQDVDYSPRSAGKNGGAHIAALCDVCLVALTGHQGHQQGSNGAMLLQRG